jgi:hypothetical protein
MLGTTLEAQLERSGGWSIEQVPRNNDDNNKSDDFHLAAPVVKLSASSASWRMVRSHLFEGAERSESARAHFGQHSSAAHPPPQREAREHSVWDILLHRRLLARLWYGCVGTARCSRCAPLRALFGVLKGTQGYSRVLYPAPLRALFEFASESRARSCVRARLYARTRAHTHAARARTHNYV